MQLNKKRFNYGNLLPDAHDKAIEAKAKSHFTIYGSKFGDDRYIDYEYFLRKYHKQINDDLYLGYYSHLITDELWLKDVYAKYMLDENNNMKKELTDKYYSDFVKLNGILINKYKLKLEVEEISHMPIGEIDSSLVEGVFKGLGSDFYNSNKVYELELFQEDDIFRFITKTISIGTDKISSISF